MTSIRVETTIESDGVLHIANLPCHRGDRVEAFILLREETDEEGREAARERFLALARESTFRSTGPYPSRDELHERD
jgi:hypothetical protein